MDDKSSKLFEEVTKDRLKRALNLTEGEDAKNSFKEAMEAVDRQIELSKLDASIKEQLRAEEAKKKEAKRERTFKYVEIGAVTIGGPIIGFFLNRGYAREICNFEKDYTFTTSAGRGLSSLFRFKK